MQLGPLTHPRSLVQVRTTHYKYLHPKEVLISDGILNRGVITGAGKSLNANDDDEFRVAKGPQAFDGTGLEFVYPFGATLSVQKPAVPVLSSGKIAYPMNRPLGAVWAQPGYGRIAVLGSCAIFDDKWLDKEENSKVMDFMFRFLKPVGGRERGTARARSWAGCVACRALARPCLLRSTAQLGA
jgi:intraflagellar transport protein 52